MYLQNQVLQQSSDFFLLCAVPWSFMPRECGVAPVDAANRVKLSLSPARLRCVVLPGPNQDSVLVYQILSYNTCRSTHYATDCIVVGVWRASHFKVVLQQKQKHQQQQSCSQARDVNAF